MSYNTDLQNNNIELQAILDTINALPEASGGLEIPDSIVAGNTPVLAAEKYAAPATTYSSYSDIGIQITIPLSGTYKFRWMATGGGSSYYAARTMLYKNGTAAGTEHSTTVKGAELSESLTCNAGDVISLRLRGYNYGGVYGSAGGLIACIDWDNGF